MIGLWPERRADQGLERKENRETGVGVSTRTENRYFRIRVQMRCSLSPNRSDVVIGQLVSLEVVQRSDEMPFLGPLSDRSEPANEMSSRPVLHNGFLLAWVLVGQDTKRGEQVVCEIVNAIFDYLGMIIGHTNIMVSLIIGF